MVSGRTVRSERPIAVFDSGVGGLTVVAELRRRLPGEDIVYFGDTARVPYGIKSSQTVTQFALQNCRFLLRFDPKLIVAACNTASAVALDGLRRALDVPVCGVIEPGAREAVRRAEGGMVAVIATEATIASDSYRRAIHRLDPTVPVVQKACPLFVPIAEEGRRADDPLLALAIRDYLDPVRELRPRVLVLGCTHYPLLRGPLSAFFGPQTVLVDSAEQTAQAVENLLRERDALLPRPLGGRLRCYVSDNPQRFQVIGSRFLGEPITNVVWVSPDRFAACDEAEAERTASTPSSVEA